MIIYKHIIIFNIYYYYIKRFKYFFTWLACNDLLILLKKVKEKYLSFKKVAKLWQKISKQDIAKGVRYI